ncbi:MAG: peptidoglycan DD-metalloendopeptidase family protein [Bacteroidales bacterium]|nr:peptidoglycan DD-metalloendopeptidase family protein [Bacteroidales bacterium]
MNKKYILIAALSVLCNSYLQAQNTETVLPPADSIFADEFVITPRVKQDTVILPEGVYVMDTLATDDKYRKIVIYSNKTWEYYDLERPSIDSTLIYDNLWDTEALHAYKSVPLASLPDSVDLLLTDAEHGACIPYQKKVYSGYKVRRGRSHNGVDLPLTVGDTIYAAFDGVVRYLGEGGETGGYGKLLIIRHSNGLETYYGHLSKRIVQVGEAVKAGEPIALGGNTGRSTGPHLHFETRYMGQTFDPERIFDFENGTLRQEMFTLYKHYFSIYSHYGQTTAQSKASSERIVYTVKKGDTLSKIASRYGTTVSKICQLNKISSTKTLRIGEKLIVR